MRRCQKYADDADLRLSDVAKSILIYAYGMLHIYIGRRIQPISFPIKNRFTQDILSFCETMRLEWSNSARFICHTNYIIQKIKLKLLATEIVTVFQLQVAPAVNLVLIDFIGSF